MTSELSPTTPRKRRQANTRQMILQKARAIIAASGPEGLSMRLLAEQIDYSPSALYEYFGSKEAIIQALCQEGFERLGQHLSQVLTEQAPSDRLIAAGMAYLEFARQNPEHYRLMFETYSARFPSFREAANNLIESATYQTLRQIVEAGLEAGEFKTRAGYDIEAMTYGCWALVHGLAMLHLTFLSQVQSGVESTALEVVDRRIIETNVKGLCTEK